MDERLGEVGPLEVPNRKSRVLQAVATAIPAGAGYGALVGAGSGFLVGLFPYLIAWIITAPLFAVVGALLGSLTAAIVGAAGAASRSAGVGGLVGSGVGAALGLVLLAAIWLAPPTMPPFGPGRPINPAATSEEEQTLERDHLRWLADQDQSERGGLTLFFAVPITLCVVTATWAAARRLERNRAEWTEPNSESGHSRC